MTDIREQTGREMTLEEWVGELPDFHFAVKEYRALLAVVEAAKDARDAIASLPIDALGEASDGELRWPIRDELIDKISKALAELDKDND